MGCSPSPLLRINLLGDFRWIYGEESVAGLNTARLQSLLAYVLLHRHTPVSRQYLANLFWPDSAESQARTNLRQAIHHLRRLFPDIERFLTIDSQIVQWRMDGNVVLDVAEFESALAAGAELSCDRTVEACEQAVGLYRGDLVPSCYDDWVFPERERLRQQCLETLEFLIRSLEECQQYGRAIHHAQRLLQIDPLHEATYRCLMRLYALNQDRANALRTYHRCATVLQRDLDIEPSSATQEIYTRLLSLEPVSVPLEKKRELMAVSPLLGRDREWLQVQTLWRYVMTGHSHLLLIEGEAGVGKTRLAEELVQWVEHQGYSAARARCYAAEGRLTYGPIAEWLQDVALHGALTGLAPVWLTELTRLIPELSIHHPDLPHPEPIREGWQQQRLFTAVAQVVLGVTPPLLLFIDDLQWCDSTTLECLHFLLRFDPKRPLLVSGTVRSEEISVDHPLRLLLLDLYRSEQVTEISLGLLDVESTTALAEHIAQRTLTPDEANHLVQQTEGHPLYIVEMMRASQLAQEANPLALHQTGYSSSLWVPEPAISPKVQAVIEFRLSQLSAPAREMAILAATLGRAFTFQELLQASGASLDQMVGAIDELWQRRIIREQGSDAYDFSHDRLREVTHAQISETRKRFLHRHVAQALEIVYAADLDPVCGRIAAHYEQAAMLPEALPYYQRAAEISQHMYANTEAIRLYNKALESLSLLPPRMGRDEQEFALQTALGVSLVATRGYGDLAVKGTYERAQHLSEKLGYPPSPPVIRALAITAIVRCELQQARLLGDQLLILTQQSQDSVQTVEAHYVAGVTSFWLGEYGSARHHLEQALDYYDPWHQHDHLTLYAQDPQVICLSRLAFTLLCLGYPQQAFQRSQSAIRLAQDLAHPFSFAYVLTWTALLHSQCRDREKTFHYAAAGIALCEESQLGIWSPMNQILQAWATAEQDVMANIDTIHSALARFRAMGAEFVRPYFLSLLAELYEQVGEITQAATLICEAQQAIQASEERWIAPEVLRREGELLAAQGRMDEAEHRFRQARSVAQQQGARLFELRATICLGSQLISQSRSQEALQIVQTTVAGFEEGLDHPDWARVQELISVLS